MVWTRSSGVAVFQNSRSKDPSFSDSRPLPPIMRSDLITVAIMERIGGIEVLCAPRSHCILGSRAQGEDTIQAVLRIDFVTLFPEMALTGVRHSILLRAEEGGLVQFHATNPRDFAADRRGTVDDKPFSGGPGMLMKPEPVDAALRAVTEAPVGQRAIVMPDPTGQLFNQEAAYQLARMEHVVFVCGHYEGIDERVAEKWITHRFSIGDYILTGGELPALVMADAIVRLLPGALGASESLDIDSHSDGLLSAPQYTRPEDWEGMTVPEVLRTGDHNAIAKWKRAESLRMTRTLRPDLFARAKLAKSDLDLLES